MSPSVRSSLCVAVATAAAVSCACRSASAFVQPLRAAPQGAMTSTRAVRQSVSPTGSRPAQRRVSSAVCMDASTAFMDDPKLRPLEDDDYVAFGLACCFVMNDDLKLEEYHVYEPLTAGTLETIAGSVNLETSYKRVTAFRAADIFEGPPARPTGIQVDKLNILLQDETANPCENMLERTMAAARTFKRRVEAQMCGFGDVMDGFNFNTDRKRILNHKFEPSFDDNVKQDKSIDVYGREEEEAVAKQVADLETI